jgi:hypothetical protein
MCVFVDMYIYIYTSSRMRTAEDDTPCTVCAFVHMYLMHVFVHMYMYVMCVFTLTCM